MMFTFQVFRAALAVSLSCSTWAALTPTTPAMTQLPLLKTSTRMSFPGNRMANLVMPQSPKDQNGINPDDNSALRLTDNNEDRSALPPEPPEQPIVTQIATKFADPGSLTQKVIRMPTNTMGTGHHLLLNPHNTSPASVLHHLIATFISVY